MTCETAAALKAAHSDLSDYERRISLAILAADSEHAVVRRAMDAALVTQRLVASNECTQALRNRQMIHGIYEGYPTPAMVKRAIKVMERFATAEDRIALASFVRTVRHNHPKQFRDLKG